MPPPERAAILCRMTFRGPDFRRRARADEASRSSAVITRASGYRRQLSVGRMLEENEDHAGLTSAARVLGRLRPGATLGPAMVDWVLAFHDALVSHCGPAKLKVARIGQRFALSFEAQRVTLPFAGIIHHHLNLPRHASLPSFPIRTDRFLRGRCTIDAAKWVGSCRTEVVRPFHCPIVPHALPPNRSAHDSARASSCTLKQLKSSVSERVIVPALSAVPARQRYCECHASPAPRNLVWLWSVPGWTIFLPTVWTTMRHLCIACDAAQSISVLDPLLSSL